MIDLFITTYKREDTFLRSFKSLLNSLTDRSAVRITVCVDGGKDTKLNNFLYENADYVLWTKDNIGLGPTINKALSHIESLNDYFDNNSSNFICMCQDDIEYEKGWLDKLVKTYRLFSGKHKIGFLSGHEAPEHEKTGEIKFGKDTLHLKPWIRATNMFAEADYFLSMHPIPRMDPETGQERARPHGGMGSSVDWHFVRNHSNSVCRSGRINIVWPGLVKHFGFSTSTWLDRDLPESHL